MSSFSFVRSRSDECTFSLYMLRKSTSNLLGTNDPSKEKFFTSHFLNKKEDRILDYSNLSRIIGAIKVAF